MHRLSASAKAAGARPAWRKTRTLHQRVEPVGAAYRLEWAGRARLLSHALCPDAKHEVDGGIASRAGSGARQAGASFKAAVPGHEGDASLAHRYSSWVAA